MAAPAPADGIRPKIGGHDQEAGQQGEGKPTGPGPGGSRQGGVGQGGGKGRIGEVPQLDPVAGQKAQIEETEDRGRDVGDRAGGGLEQQPTADHRATGRKHGGSHFGGHLRHEPATAGGRLSGDQQQLHRHQGGAAGRTDPLEAGHAEELEQAEVHDHANRQGEPPAPEHHHQKAEATGGPTAGQTGQRGGGAGAGNQRSAAITKRGSAAANLAWLPRRCIRCTVACTTCTSWAPS